jgi:hypothetical protein
MIQTGLADAITDSTNIARGRLKTPAPATAILLFGKEGLEG